MELGELQTASIEQPSLNILYLTDRCDRGESALILGMHEQGMQVHVFGRLDSPHVQCLRDSGVPVSDTRWDNKLSLGLIRLIRNTIVSEQVDIVHAMNSRTTMHMVLATKSLHRRAPSPRLVAYLGVTGNVSWLSPISWVRFLNPRISRIICVAEGVRQYLLNVQFLGIKLSPSKVVTIHKGHKLDWYQSKPASLGEFGIPPEAMVITVASRLRPRKGLNELVQALGLTDPNKNIHVLFLGHEGNTEMRHAVAALPHPMRVHFAGFRQNAPAIIAASDVCCLPVLRGEGLSRAIIEGMAYGVAPLVTDVGGNAELVVDGECGLVVPPGNIGKLADAIEYFYDHPGQRQRMGRAAQARIDNQFRSEETLRKTLALYREIMSQ